MVLLERVKAYMRIASREEDDVISELIEVAKQNIESRTGKTFIPTDPQWILAVKLLVSYWYDNRSPVAFNATPTALPHSLDMLITEIALRKDTDV